MSENVDDTTAPPPHLVEASARVRHPSLPLHVFVADGVTTTLEVPKWVLPWASPTDPITLAALRASGYPTTRRGGVCVLQPRLFTTLVAATW